MATIQTAIAYGAIGSRPAAGSPGHVYFSTEPATYRDNGSSWDDVSDAGGGGGVTQEYLGNTSVGASDLTPTNRRTYAVPITVSSDRLIASVDIHMKGNGSNVNNIYGMLYSDSSGAPLNMLARSYMAGVTLFLNANYRWMRIPLGAWVVAGDYWVAAGMNTDTTPDFRFAYDATGGTGAHLTHAGEWIGEGTWTASTQYWSIRANTIR